MFKLKFDAKKLDFWYVVEAVIASPFIFVISLICWGLFGFTTLKAKLF